MRIVMAMAGLGGGGAERFFERLALAFLDRGHEPVAVIRPAGRRAERLSAAGIAVHTCRFGGPLDLRTGLKIRKLLERVAPDGILSFMSRAAGAIPRTHKAPHVARLGGYYALKHFRTADHLVGNTQHICDWLIEQGAEADRVEYIPNFVDMPVDKPAERAALNTPPDAPLIVALGRLHPNKAFDTLLKAVADHPGWYLWLGGEGPEQASLAGLAARLGIADRVRFPGWVEEPGPLLAAADVVAVPSRLEPLGNVVLEAWSHAKPVVAAASTGPSHLIENGVSGRLVPVDEPARLGAALNDVLEMPDRGAALGEAGRHHLQSAFSADAVVGQYVDLFSRIRKRMDG